MVVNVAEDVLVFKTFDATNNHTASDSGSEAYKGEPGGGSALQVVVVQQDKQGASQGDGGTIIWVGNLFHIKPHHHPTTPRYTIPQHNHHPTTHESHLPGQS